MASVVSSSSTAAATAAGRAAPRPPTVGQCPQCRHVGYVPGRACPSCRHAQSVSVALPLAPRACLDALLLADLDNGSAPLFSEYSLDADALTAAAVRAAALRRAYASDIEPRLEREPPVVVALLLKQWLFSMLTSPLLSHSHAPRFVELAGDLERGDVADRVAKTLAELFQLIAPRSVALVDALAAVLARLTDAAALHHAATALAPILLWPNTSNDSAPPSLIEPAPGADALVLDVVIPVLQCTVAVRLAHTATARDVIYAATVQCGQIDAMAAYNGAFRLYLPPPRNLLCEITAPLAPFALTQFDGAVVVPADQGALAQEREERIAISTSLWRFLANHHALVFNVDATGSAAATPAADDDELSTVQQVNAATLRRSTDRLAARNALSNADKITLLQKRFPNTPTGSFEQVLGEVQGDVNEAISLLSLHRNYGNGSLQRSNTLASILPSPPGVARPMPKVPNAAAAAPTPSPTPAPAVKVPAAMRPAAPLPPGVVAAPAAAAAQSPKPQPRVFSIKPVFSGPPESQYQNASLVVPPGAGDVRLDEHGGAGPIYQAPSVIVPPLHMQQQQMMMQGGAPGLQPQQQPPQQQHPGGLQPVYGPTAVAAAAAMEMERGKTIKGAPGAAAPGAVAAGGTIAPAKGPNKFSKLMGKVRAAVGGGGGGGGGGAAAGGGGTMTDMPPVETMPSSPLAHAATEVVHASVAGTVNGQLMLVTPQGMVIKCQVPGCAMAYRTQEELSFHERKRHADLMSAMETGELSPRFGSLKRSDAGTSDDGATVVSDESSQRSDVVVEEQSAAATPAAAPVSSKPKPVHLCKAYYESAETYITVPVYESTTPQDIIDFFRRRMKFDGVVVVHIRLALGERWRPDASVQLLTSLGLRKLTSATVELCNANGELLRGVVRGKDPTPAVPTPTALTPTVTTHVAAAPVVTSARNLQYGGLPGEDSVDTSTTLSTGSARNYGTLPPEDDDFVAEPVTAIEPVVAVVAAPNRPHYQRSVSAVHGSSLRANASDKQYQSAALQKTAPLVVKVAFLSGTGEPSSMNYVVSKLSTSRAVVDAFVLKQRHAAPSDELLLRIAFAPQDAAHASSGQLLLCDDIPLLLTYSRMALERAQFAIVIASTMQLCVVAATNEPAAAPMPVAAVPAAAPAAAPAVVPSRNKPLPPTPPAALAAPTRAVRKRSHSASSLPTVHYAGFGVPPDDPRPPRPARPRPGTVAFKDAAAIRAALAAGTEPQLPSQQRTRDPSMTLRIAFTARGGTLPRARLPAAEDPYASLPSLEELRKLQSAQMCDQCGMASAGAQVFNPGAERTLFLCRPCAISVADALGGDALDHLERPEKPPRPTGGAIRKLPHQR
jgi:hypothetical protein